MKKNPHTTFTRGKRVFVKLCDGSLFIDKFIEKLSKGVVFFDKGLVKTSNIKSISIYKEPSK